ncbi:MAG: competence protein ComEC [Caulobacteraceae bacterium]|nr:competence protein ComEC [Caulobacteraceae bacterium]
MRRARLPRPAELSTWLRAEIAAQRERAVLWAPVAFGLGAAAFLGLKAEPSVWGGAGLAAAGLVGFAASWIFSRHVGVIACAGLAALAAAGFLVAKLHSDGVAAPIAPARGGVVTLEGWVVDIDTPSEKGERVLIAPVAISGLAPEATPTRVRIVLPGSGGPESAPPPGTPIRLTTLLDPPPGPAAPGAYDFARDAWFEGIGGVGLAMRAPVMTALPTPPWPVRLEMAVNALRWRVAGRLAHDITAVLGPDDGGAAGLAAAVTTSHQDWLAADHRDELRGSGLAHMLAIAGLHTAAVSGFAFFAFRFAVAIWPWLALRVPGKKVAAVAALAVVAGYLVLSGAHPPARRAAITASVAFLAILVDRRAVSLHSLAVAALIILFLEPEVVVQPGFEMSFCATASLVALAEVWRRRADAGAGLPWPLAMARKLRGWLVAMAVVSFVAGAATGPFAIQHFNRVANYGVLANLSADFVASALLMPSLALALFAQAVGLSASLAAPVLWLAGESARAVIFLGRLFAGAPGAAMTLSSAPEIALAISYLGIVFACLWRGRLRWIGLPMSAAVALWPRPTPPVAWIAADGDDAAVVVAGREIPMKPGARGYATQLWAQRRGFTLVADAAAAGRAVYDCDRRGCLPLGAVRPAMSASWMRKAPRGDRFADLCAGADIVILRSAFAPAGPCGHALVLTRADFERGGAAEVFADGAGWRLAWSQPQRGHRPWTGS